MLSLEYLEDKVYTNNIVKMYQKLNTEIVNDIISRLKSEGNISSYTKAQIRNLTKRGGKEVFINALQKTNSLSAQRKKELINLFSEIGIDNVESYKSLYDYKDEKLELSPSQINILNTMVKSTDKELKNFTKTIAFSSQNEFVNAVDNMYFQVATGVIDFQKAFRKTTNDLAEKGITLPMKNGVNRSLEAAVRQNVMYGIRQSVQLINDDIGEQLGCDGVQINISPNCRPEHHVINGKRFRVKSKEWKDNKDLLKDYNCQHYATPIIYDIEDNIYSKAEIQRANNKTIKYNNEEIPYYEATQKQRALERQVRNAKKAYESSPSQENKAKVLQAQKNVRNYCNETGLERQYDREYFAGYNK